MIITWPQSPFWLPVQHECPLSVFCLGGFDGIFISVTQCGSFREPAHVIYRGRRGNDTVTMREWDGELMTGLGPYL